MAVKKFKIRKDDQVMVIKGREAGKTGKVTRLNPEKATVIVDKLNMIKRHQKPSAKYKHGGIIEKEAPIAVANVMILCEKCKGPVRVGRKILEGGKKVRYCKKCGEVI
ncbi:MAG: 50S ribosomal protein L24 [Thermodesulfobacteriota bacterium]|nr:MAG: 50S ribosomal protein L24 [Thermodesulfobacteriota bacterium]